MQPPLRPDTILLKKNIGATTAATYLPTGFVCPIWHELCDGYPVILSTISLDTLFEEVILSFVPRSRTSSVCHVSTESCGGRDNPVECDNAALAVKFPRSRLKPPFLV